MAQIFDTHANSILIHASYVNGVALLADGLGDSYAGSAGSDAYLIENGTTGDDVLTDFNTWDSLITGKAIYGADGDGYIFTNDAEILDLDRYGPGAGRAGPDQLVFTGDMSGVRYLGTKDGLQFVYADADVRLALEDTLGKSVTEGTVGNDSLSAAGENAIYFYDNALGLNLGGDTITAFGKNDYIVTTVALYDGNHDGILRFGRNGVLDLSGGVDPTGAGGDVNAAGQIKFASPATRQLYFQDEIHVDVHGIDTTYFIYAGSADSTRLA